MLIPRVSSSSIDLERTEEFLRTMLCIEDHRFIQVCMSKEVYESLESLIKWLVVTHWTGGEFKGLAANSKQNTKNAELVASLKKAALLVWLRQSKVCKLLCLNPETLMEISLIYRNNDELLSELINNYEVNSHEFYSLAYDEYGALLLQYFDHFKKRIIKAGNASNAAESLGKSMECLGSFCKHSRKFSSALLDVYFERLLKVMQDILNCFENEQQCISMKKSFKNVVHSMFEGGFFSPLRELLEHKNELNRTKRSKSVDDLSNLVDTADKFFNFAYNLLCLDAPNDIFIEYFMDYELMDLIEALGIEVKTDVAFIKERAAMIERQPTATDGNSILYQEAIRQIHSMFPLLGMEKVERCIVSTAGNIEMAISMILEDNIPPTDDNSIRRLSSQISQTSIGDATRIKKEYSLNDRTNVFDNDSFDTLKNRNANPIVLEKKQIKLIDDIDFVRKYKEQFLSQNSDEDAYNDEYDDAIDYENSGVSIATPVTEAELMRPHSPDDSGTASSAATMPSKKEKFYSKSQLDELFGCLVKHPECFERSSEARKSSARTELAKRTGLGNSQIEGWSAMLNKNVNYFLIKTRKRMIIQDWMAMSHRRGDANYSDNEGGLKEEGTEFSSELEGKGREGRAEPEKKTPSATGSRNRNRKGKSHDQKHRAARKLDVRFE
jgi:hypothetical protein